MSDTYWPIVMKKVRAQRAENERNDRFETEDGLPLFSQEARVRFCQQMVYQFKRAKRLRDFGIWEQVRGCVYMGLNLSLCSRHQASRYFYEIERNINWLKEDLDREARESSADQRRPERVPLDHAAEKSTGEAEGLTIGDLYALFEADIETCGLK